MVTKGERGGRCEEKREWVKLAVYIRVSDDKASNSDSLAGLLRVTLGDITPEMERNINMKPKIDHFK
ncbi:hypothetical protein RRG08_011881 [Elysia crispata]|uniref:Uncharacterized protein n=1 Tax=Elysia crispata TaxID=231223 RepID=A0AAE0ZM31_9GAST|nr:hypothetical protein RRG08_011881 [Elysia crispata]